MKKFANSCTSENPNSELQYAVIFGQRFFNPNLKTYVVKHDLSQIFSLPLAKANQVICNNQSQRVRHYLCFFFLAWPFAVIYECITACKRLKKFEFKPFSIKFVQAISIICPPYYEKCIVPSVDKPYQDLIRRKFVKSHVTLSLLSWSSTLCHATRPFLNYSIRCYLHYLCSYMTRRYSNSKLSFFARLNSYHRFQLPILRNFHLSTIVMPRKEQSAFTFPWSGENSGCVGKVWTRTKYLVERALSNLIAENWWTMANVVLKLGFF